MPADPLIVTTAAPHTGEMVNLYRDLAGTVGSGKRVRINVDGTIYSPTGDDNCNEIAKRMLDRIIAKVPLNNPNRSPETNNPAVRLGQWVPVDDGSYRRHLTFTFDATTNQAYAGPSDLIGEVRRNAEFNDPDDLVSWGTAFDTRDGGVYASDLSDGPDQSFINEVQHYERAQTSAFVKEAVREEVAAVSAGIGAVTSGIWGGLSGGIITALIIGLLLVGLIVFLYFKTVT